MQTTPQHSEELSEHRPRNAIEMSRNPVMCRVCLSMNVRMFSIAETPLQTLYEKIVDAPLYTTDIRPVTACFICCAQLRKCYNLMTMATKSENVLTEILETYPEVSTRSAVLMDLKANNLSLSTIPVECFDTSSFDLSTYGNTHQECIKLKNEAEYEEVEYEESLEPEMTEYDINVVKCESNMDADMLWKTCDEALELNTEVKIEVQDDVQEGELPVQDTENQTDANLVESEQHESHRHTKVPHIYQCKFCLRVYTNKNSYSKHIDAHQIHECNICKHRFSTKNNLTRHLSTHSEDRPYQCNVCNRRFRLKHYLKRHKYIHNDNEYKNEDYKCDICRRYFKQNSALTAHLRTHTGEKPFECDVCQRRFASKFNLQNHLRTHSGEKPFECDVCNARFIHRTSLRQHKMTHTGEKPHKCHICQRGFTQSSHMKDHLKSHKMKSPSHESD